MLRLVRSKDPNGTVVQAFVETRMSFKMRFSAKTRLSTGK